MSKVLELHRFKHSELTGVSPADRSRVTTTRLLVAGGGNIGSHLAKSLALQQFKFVRIIDRGYVEPRNFVNQAFDQPGDLGRPKAEVLAEKMRAINSDMVVESVVADLADVPQGLISDVDLCLAGLDGLRARQILANEYAYPQGVTVIDGAVDGSGGWFGKVQVLIPGASCLECSWGTPHYRELSQETPCDPQADTAVPPTNAPPLLGAAVADLMITEAVKLLTQSAPAASYEIAFDLHHDRVCSSRLQRSSRCRFDHVVIREHIPLGMAFAAATIGDLLSVVSEQFRAARTVQLQFRRRLFDVGLFGSHRTLGVEQLAPYAARRLAELNLTRQDQIRVTAEGRDAYICLG